MKGWFIRMDSISPDTPQKQCKNPDCKQWFPATTEYFYPIKTGKYGVAAICKKCYSRQNAANYQKNRKRILEKAKQRHPLIRENKRAYNRTYYQEHKERINALNHAWNSTHVEEMKAYRRAHPEIDKKHHALRRMRKLQSGGTFTVEDVQVQYNRQKGKCYWCNTKLDSIYHVDHIIPLSRGGSNAPDNLVVACPSCNQSKHDKLPHEWDKGGKLL